MIHKVDSAKDIPYGMYKGYIIKKEEDASGLVGKNDGWIWRTNSPKSIILFVKQSETEFFDV